MVILQNYLIFSNEASLRAETSTDPMMKKHFIQMSEQWRKMAEYSQMIDERGSLRARMN